MSRSPIAVVHDDLQAHPVVQAWTHVWPAPDIPERIEVLRRLTSSTVYRLVGAGPAGQNVIAKRTPAEQAAVELIVYERVLPYVSVTSPRCYGSRPTDGQLGYRWIFLEDVGANRYSDANKAHRMMAARWVSRMHGSAANLPAARELPDGGPSRYLAHLRSARDKIQLRLSGPNLTDQDTAMLRHVIKVLQALESRWHRIEGQCVGLPATVVHGDFRPKNVYLRSNGRGLACYPIDWETAGWGVPAADLTRIDLATYCACAREWHGGLELDTVRKLFTVGQMFCAIAGIDWDSTSLRFDTRRMFIRELASIEVLTGRLAVSARAIGVLT